MALGDVWKKIRGTIGNLFQLGGPSGPNLKNSSGVIEARNSADSGYAIVRGAAPVAGSDLVTKAYADTLGGFTVVTAQFDGNNALPANTGTAHFYVVTTTGPNATIGNLVYDDGSSSGTATVIATAERAILTTVSLTGGTITFQADSVYVWDSGSTSWLGGSAVSGAQRVVRYAITNSATQDSAIKIPPNAYVFSCILEVTTPYSGGATISIGRSGSTSLLQATTDNVATVAGSYEVPQDTSWGGTALAVRTTVSGAPAAGAGVVIVAYSVPDA